MLGGGWSLAGLSVIHRFQKTTAQDGAPKEARGITFTANDRFCLDGQKLITITGNYGAANSEYRTEIDGVSSVSVVREDDASLVINNAANTEALENF